jgi:hypothetical protein
LTLKDFLAHWQTQRRQMIVGSNGTDRPKSFQKESPRQIAGQIPVLKIFIRVGELGHLSGDTSRFALVAVTSVTSIRSAGRTPQRRSMANH